MNALGLNVENRRGIDINPADAVNDRRQTFFVRSLYCSKALLKFLIVGKTLEFACLLQIDSPGGSDAERNRC